MLGNDDGAFIPLRKVHQSSDHSTPALSLPSCLCYVLKKGFRFWKLESLVYNVSKLILVTTSHCCKTLFLDQKLYCAVEFSVIWLDVAKVQNIGNFQKTR